MTDSHDAAIAIGSIRLNGHPLAQPIAPGGIVIFVIALNPQALTQLTGVKMLHIVPGASHLFEEPGTLEEAARVAAAWFDQHFDTCGRAP